MEVEEIIGFYKILEQTGAIKHIRIWSCFFKYHGKLNKFIHFHIDVKNMMDSEELEDSLTLKEASTSFVQEFKK